MRKEFSSAIEQIGGEDPDLVFLTGDLGFHALENVAERIGDRFINAGVAEQNMISVAAGMAYMGLKPWTYSIAPFIALKTVEQVRNDVCHLRLPVKLVGNGGGYGYGIMGATHHILEDLAILGSLPNMRVFVPAFNEDIEPIVRKMHGEKSPGYLRLGLARPHVLKLPRYTGIRNIQKGTAVTAVVLGPLVHNVLDALVKLAPENVDLWVITEFPLSIPRQFLQSIMNTRKLLIIEEHTRIGGIGELLLTQLTLEKALPNVVVHLHTKGYPSHLYGSQAYHLTENELDTKGITKHLKKLLRHG